MRRSRRYFQGRGSCDALWLLGRLLLLCSLSQLCNGFLVKAPSLTVPGRDSCLAPARFGGRCVLLPLHSEKGSGIWPITFFRRPKKEEDKYTPARSASYLITMDKQRGYHRKAIGPIAKVVNNTEVKFTSSEKVAGALGKLSSKAFK